MAALLKKVQQKDIYILNGGVEVENIEDSLCSVSVSTKQFEFRTGKLLIATNGFASRFIADDIKPARAQVLLTEPLKTLHVKGTFHLDRGYYYFRNIGNRILLGGVVETLIFRAKKLQNLVTPTSFKTNLKNCYNTQFYRSQKLKLNTVGAV